MEEKVFAVLRNAMENDDLVINVDDLFRDYAAWDSLARMSLIAELDEQFGVSIASEDFDKLKTVGDLVNEIAKQSK